MSIAENSRVWAIIRWTISLVLVGLLVLILARLVWLIIAPAGTIQADQASIDLPDDRSTASADAGGVESFDVYLLTEINPFLGGETSEAARQVAEQERIGNVKESSLDIEYIGGRSTLGGTSVAFVRVPNSTKTLYYEGDELINGYKIYQIEPLRLIIEREGELESVLLYGESVITGITRDFDEDVDAPVRPTAAPGTTGRPDTTQLANGLPVPTRSKDGDEETGQPIDGGSFTIKANDLMTNATFARSRSRGLSVGIILTPTRDRTILERVGLERTDIITAVNGVNFQNINDAELLEQITKGGVLRLNVDRAGYDVPVTVSLRIEKEA